MSAIRTPALATLLLLAVTLVGCQETFKITVTNLSAQPHNVLLTTPEGFDSWTMAPEGRIVKKVSLDADELPAGASLRVDGKDIPFTLDKKGHREMFFYIEDDGVVGPLGPNDKMRRARHSETIHRGEPREKVTGDPVSPDAPPAPAPGVPREVIE